MTNLLWNWIYTGLNNCQDFTVFYIFWKLLYACKTQGKAGKQSEIITLHHRHNNDAHKTVSHKNFNSFSNKWTGSLIFHFRYIFSLKKYSSAVLLLLYSYSTSCCSLASSSPSSIIDTQHTNNSHCSSSNIEVFVLCNVLKIRPSVSGLLVFCLFVF